MLLHSNSFSVVSFTDTLCNSCYVPQSLFASFFWLGYFNSCLNPFIYAATSNQFKRAFQRILCRRKWRRQRALSYASSYRTTSLWSKSASNGGSASGGGGGVNRGHKANTPGSGRLSASLKRKSGTYLEGIGGAVAHFGQRDKEITAKGANKETEEIGGNKNLSKSVRRSSKYSTIKDISGDESSASPVIIVDRVTEQPKEFP